MKKKLKTKNNLKEKKLKTKQKFEQKNIKKNNFMTSTVGGAPEAEKFRQQSAGEKRETNKFFFRQQTVEGPEEEGFSDSNL